MPQSAPAAAEPAAVVAAPEAGTALPAPGGIAAGGITKRASGASAEPAPCRTLYARNLDEKRGSKELRLLLHALFSPHGEVEWISAHKTLKLRGQAFITFRDLASATAALRRLQGSMFLDRPLHLQYARQQSHRPLGRTAKRRVRGGATDVGVTAGKSNGGEAGGKGAQTAAPSPTKTAPRVPEQLTPNRILFAEQVPPGDALGERCARFAGFVEVRPVPAKPTISFVEFASEQHAAVAVSALNGTVIVDGTAPLKLSYAKK